MKSIVFASAQDAEAAFYEAFENCDINAMMAVWVDEEEVVCIHPSGARLTGTLKVRDSWRQIFTIGIKLNFRITGRQYVTELQLAIHNVYEHITVVDEAKSRNPIIATNVYILTESKWRMLMHHWSQVPDKAVVPLEPTPTTLH